MNHLLTGVFLLYYAGHPVLYMFGQVMNSTIRADGNPKFTMTSTLDSCSICLLTHKDKNCDLVKLFASYGVKVVSGSDFEGLGANSVRLRLPPQEQEKALPCIVRDIDRGASDKVS